MKHYNVDKVIYCKRKLHSFFEWFRSDSELSMERNGYKYVIMCNGVFDIPHIGHMDLFEKVRWVERKRGNFKHNIIEDDNSFKVLAINSDKSVKSIKGDKRPFFSVEERIEFIKHLNIFDLIIPFDEDSPLEVMKIVRPDIIYKTKGGPYSKDSIPILERKLIRENLTIIEWVPYIENISTTKIVERILEKERS